MAAVGERSTAEGVECRELTKAFGPVTAVDGPSLEVAPGEIMALLGPSGCGKTTFLRLVAGFEQPDAGWVRLAGEVVAGPGRFTPPERRRIGTRERRTSVATTPARNWIGKRRSTRSRAESD